MGKSKGKKRQPSHDEFRAPCVCGHILFVHKILHPSPCMNCNCDMYRRLLRA